MPGGRFRKHFHIEYANIRGESYNLSGDAWQTEVLPEVNNHGRTHHQTGLVRQRPSCGGNRLGTKRQYQDQA